MKQSQTSDLKSKPNMKVAILTSGGLAPCLSSAVGYLIEIYSRISPKTEIICYLNGYRGLLLGESIKITESMRFQAPKLQHLGGSPIGNSRVHLKNAKDCAKRGLVKVGESPQKVAALQLIKDEITILHTIGGDDTNMSAGDLSVYLRKNFNNYKLDVIGLPKTIDNDVYPVSQTLGCQTASEQGALFFQNVVSEYSSNPKMLIVHEIMGRNSGWLAAKTAQVYTAKNRHEFPSMVDRSKTQIHAVYVPESTFDINEESKRLKEIMNKQGCVNVFLSEGSCSELIIAEREAKGLDLKRDAFGHVSLNTLNAGKWFVDQMAPRIGAEKVLVQKSGYFCRASPANDFDRRLIKKCCEKAVQYAMEGKTGLSGPDQNANDEIRCIDYSRVSGGKPFDLSTDWFIELMSKIGQKIIPLNVKSNQPYFSYEPSEVATIDKNEPNIDYYGAQDNSHLVSISTVGLISVSSEESDAVEKLIYKSYCDQKHIKSKEVENLSEICFSLMTCFKNTSNACKMITNKDSSESFKSMVRSGFLKSLGSLKHVKTVTSDGKNTILNTENQSNETKYSIVLDPVDGSQNIESNVSIGTIFGVFEENENQTDKDCNKVGKDLKMSGYCLYGAATILIISFGKGVFGFTLDIINNRFILSHENIKIPKNGKFYSVNEGYINDWSEKVKKFILDLKNENKSLRYTGTLVADVHRSLLYGGVFLYPENNIKKEGKLDLISELIPLALILEQAGGKAIDTSGKRILDKPAKAFTKSSVVLGSSDLIKKFKTLTN